MRCHCGQVHSVDIHVEPRTAKAEALQRLRALIDQREVRIGAPIRVEITDAGRDALVRSEGYESNPLSLFRQRQRIDGALTIAEQAAWIRNRSSDDDSSSAQPHRFRSAE